MKFKALIFLLFMILYLQVSQGQNSFYVSPEGIDQVQGGGIDQPLASLEYAAEWVNPGDTIFLRAGQYYNDSYNNGNIWVGDSYASITLNGTPDQVITIKAYPGEYPVIHFDHSYGLHLINSSYVVVEGLEIRGIGGQIDYQEAISAWGLYKKNGVIYDLAKELGIDPSDPALIGQSIDKVGDPDIQKPGYYNGRGLVANKSHHVVLKNNKVFDAPSSGMRIQQCDYAMAIGNEVAYCTYWTSQGVGALTVAEASSIDQNDERKIEILQNQVHHNENKLVSWNPGKDFIKFVIDEGSGIFLTRNADTYAHGEISIVNNLSYNNGARGIVVHKTNRAIVDHNSLYFNGANCSSDAAGIGVNSVTEVMIRNNIVYSRPDKFALGILAQPVNNLDVSHNLLFNDFGTEDLSRNIENGWEEADPKYENPDSGNLKIKANSPARDAALLVDNPSIDFYGEDRADMNPDIGAIEYVYSTSHTNPMIQETIQFYPNPFSDRLFLYLPQGISSVSIFNTMGEKVIDIPLKRNFTRKQEISLEWLQAGLYFIRFGNRMYKIIKE